LLCRQQLLLSLLPQLLLDQQHFDGLANADQIGLLLPLEVLVGAHAGGAVGLGRGGRVRGGGGQLLLLLPLLLALPLPLPRLVLALGAATGDSFRRCFLRAPPRRRRRVVLPGLVLRLEQAHQRGTLGLELHLLLRGAMG